jgi:hypothetical protein
VVVGAAAVGPLVACAVLSAFRDSIANTNAALALVLLVVAAASTGIRVAGLVAALSCATWFDFFLTEPYHLFTITDPADIETALLLVLVGVAVSEIALWGRRQQAEASREQRYLDGVLSTAATVGAGGRSTSALVDEVCEHIVDILEVDTCRFDLGSGPVLAVLHDDATMTYNGHPYDVHRHGLPPTPRSHSWPRAAAWFAADSCSPPPPASCGRRRNNSASRSRSPARSALHSPSPTSMGAHRASVPRRKSAE